MELSYALNKKTHLIASLKTPPFYLKYFVCVLVSVGRRVIKEAIKGEGFIGIATTEEGGGSDVANVKSTAKKEDDTWVLNGEKLYVSGTEEAKK